MVAAEPLAARSAFAGIHQFLKALLDAPPGRVEVTAQALLSSKPAQHPLFMEIAEIEIQAEIDICEESRWRRMHAEEMKKEFFFYTFEAGRLLKTKAGGHNSFDSPGSS